MSVSNPAIRRLGRAFLGDILDQILVEELLVSHDECLFKGGWLLARLPSTNQGIDPLATAASLPEGLRRKHVKSVKKLQWTASRLVSTRGHERAHDKCLSIKAKASFSDLSFYLRC